jgi:hypothetical protein
MLLAHLPLIELRHREDSVWERGRRLWIAPQSETTGQPNLPYALWSASGATRLFFQVVIGNPA